MSLPVIFKSAALLELEEAVAWHEDAQPGLGKDFKVEVKAALKRALDHPERFPKARGAARKIRLKRFKQYAIYFAVSGTTFAVLAVFHGARDPAQLLRRLK